jgi:hypothetical protein
VNFPILYLFWWLSIHFYPFLNQAQIEYKHSSRLGKQWFGHVGTLTAPVWQSQTQFPMCSSPAEVISRGPTTWRQGDVQKCVQGEHH